MRDAIECFVVAVFVLVGVLFIYLRAKPFIEREDDKDKKKKWFLFFRIILIAGCICSLSLILVGILIITGILT